MKKILFGVAALGLLGLAGAGIGLKGQDTVEAKAATYIDDEYVAPSLAYKTVFCTYIYLDGGTTWDAAPYVHYWGSSIEPDTTWPGKAMTWCQNNEFSQGVYSFDIPADVTGFLFTDSSGSKQTVDISNATFTDYNAYFVNNETDGSGHYYAGWYAKDTNVVYSIDLKNDTTPKYVYGWDNTNLSTNNGWRGKETHRLGTSTIYYKELTSAYNSFIVTDDTAQSGDIQPATMNGSCFVIDSSISGTKTISIEAAQFIDENMRFATIPTSTTTDGTDCLGFYSSVKSAYDNLSSNSVRLEVLSILDVQERLSAWAVANGDTLDTSTGGRLAASKMVLGSTNNPSASFSVPMAIAVVAIAVTLLSIGTFLARKHRAE